MRLVSYIVYSLREWQVHMQECFHTSVSISRTDDTIHHLPSSPPWDLQCMVQMFVPLGRWIAHFYVCFLLSSCITSVGLWTAWPQVKIHTVYTYFWVKLLVMLAEGWTFHWNAAELLSKEFRFVHSGVESTDWYLTKVQFLSYDTELALNLLLYNRRETVLHEVSMWWQWTVSQRNSTLHCAEMCCSSMSCNIPDTHSLNFTWPGWKTTWIVCYKPNSFPSLIHKKSFSSKSICLTSVMRAKCGICSTLCWKLGNISGSTELFAL